MRLPALFAVAGLTLGAAACASVEPAPPTPPALAPIAGYDWLIHTAGETAQLAFGVDETDDVWLSLACERGSGRVQLTQPVPDGHPTVISLESGGDTETFPAEAEASDLHEGLFLTTEADASAPVFQRFRRVGWLASYGPEYRHPMVPHPGSEDRIERFFAFCG